MIMSEIALPSGSEPSKTTHQWAVWTILKQELLYISWALMQVALIAPIAIFIMEWARFWPTFQVTLWLLLLMLLPFNLGRFLSAFQVSKSWQLRIIFASLIGTFLITWKFLLFPTISIFDFGWFAQLTSNFAVSGSELWTKILIIFVLLIFTWWRGLSLINFKADIQRVGLMLRAGILFLIPLSLLPYQKSGFFSVMPFVLLFILSGLTAISLIRAEQVEKDRSGYSASLSPRWVITIFLTSLLIVSFSGLAALIVSGEISDVVGQWFSPLRMAIIFAAAVALSTVFYLSTPLFFVFGQLLVLLTNLFSAIFTNISERLEFSLPSNLGGLGELLPSSEEAVETTGFAIPDVVSRLLILAVMLAIIILVSSALTRRFRNAAFASREENFLSDGDIEKLESPSLGQRLLERLGFVQRWRTAASVRNIYRQMCRAAGSVGYPRAETETPFEYLKTLSEVWPNGQEESRLITEAFVRIRYGEIPETDAELQTIHKAWQKLEQTKPIS